MPQSLRRNISAAFGDKASLLSPMTPQQRILWACDQHNDLVMTSSFGVQSIVLLKLALDINPRMPVICVDIPGNKYDTQRSYRDFLHQKMGFDLRIFPARNDADKVAAMDRGLESIGAKAVLAGIMHGQTENRATKNFIEIDSGSGIVMIHPVLDWDDINVGSFILSVDPDLWHPKYKPGVQSVGGRILESGESKIECGLHIRPDLS